MASLPLIRISPSEFQFSESRAGYTSRLRLTNLQNQAVGFKFKTNAPHKFLVRPVVCSLTKKGMAIDVVVKSTSPINDADRFLIQTVALDIDEAEGLDSTKWRTLDPTRIMEDLIHCTLGRRRSSVSSQDSLSPPASPTLVAVSHVYDPYTPLPSHKSYEKQDERFANGLARRFYDILPGIDLNDWSWSEFGLFVAACFILGFLVPVFRYALSL
ncbi:hypothetical protein GGI25_003826 [Coemansia spiralis]|uniref:MSP domain-containing protein n=2 Tax=Coemansia TaxID=4863 RepID=A0A9W8G1C2_9FUNG|nr:hypothetical protein BX070DRAFT_141075 [Coemansia spiralis]KAJ1990973.1 hypothetical protein EDC05_003693 [Coemansia umbellata]KAJ2620983.1 hypothetical protein GGI26_004483 [Coemansia sp. RSA 1358]KAJ2675732.1 hypothetical protein GGI25_003826 [Coemansia spiralis]